MRLDNGIIKNGIVRYVERRISMGKTKICPKCGTEVDAVVKFCGGCGFRFPVDVPQVVPDPAPMQSVSSQPAPVAQPSPQVNNSGNMSIVQDLQTPKSPNKKGLVAVLACIAVLLMAGIVVAVGYLLGWFAGNPTLISLSERKITVMEGEQFDIKVTNFSDLNSQDLEWVIEDESIATVEVGRNGKAVITGESAGKTILTVSGRNCESATLKITVDAQPVVVTVDDSVVGKAWETSNGIYYFLDDGTFYFISEAAQDYMKGSYTYTETDENNAYASELDGFVQNPVYYMVNVHVNLEEFYGETRDFDLYLAMAHGDSGCAVYASDWGNASMADEVVMKDRQDLDDYFTADDVDLAGVDTPDSDPTAGSGTSFSGAAFSEYNSKESWRCFTVNGKIIVRVKGDAK